MKKLLLTLFIIGLTGTLCSIALCGQIYFNERKVYEDHQRKDLDIKNLDNIIIDTSVDTYIYTTDTVPYVEFKQKFVDVLGKHPAYTLDLETKNNTSYIKLLQTQQSNKLFFVTDNTAILNIYLPKQAIDKLHVNKVDGSNYGPQIKDLTLDMQNINIKDLDVTASGITALLSGNYDEMAIDASYGSVNIFSSSPSKVNITGGINSTLTGSFENINVGIMNNTLFIDSLTPTSVTVDGGDDIRLKGNYSQIQIESDYNSIIDISSGTLCKVDIDGSSSELKLSGALDTLTISGNNQDVYISSTTIPKLINILEHAQVVTLMLPSNTPGFNATCIWKDDSHHTLLSGDFPIQEKFDNPNATRYFFGNKQVELFIKTYDLQNIYVLDNGYHSKDAAQSVESEETISETFPIGAETHPTESESDQPS